MMLLRNGSVKKILSFNTGKFGFVAYLAARAQEAKLVGGNDWLVLMSSMELTREKRLYVYFGDYSCSYFEDNDCGRTMVSDFSSSGGAFERSTTQVSMLSQSSNEVQWLGPSLRVEDLTKLDSAVRRVLPMYFQMLFIRPCLLLGFESRVDEFRSATELRDFYRAVCCE